MIDIGIEISIAKAGGATVPVTAWEKLNDCVSMPALIQPSTKIATDFIGDEFTSEMLGKRALTALDFVFAYDTGDEGGQFRFLADAADDDAEGRWLRVKYPDGTLFEMLVRLEVSLIAPAPSAELDYTLSVTPIRNTIGDLIIITYPDGSSPLDAPASTEGGSTEGGSTEGD